MSDIASTIAIVATILFCGNGEPMDAANRCQDGSAVQSADFEILGKERDGSQFIFRLTQNGKERFRVSTTGQLTSDGTFPDERVAQFLARATGELLDRPDVQQFFRDEH